MSELSMLADEQMRAESDALYHAGMGDKLSLDREKCDEVVRLRHENAKLRELVRDAWGEGHPDISCGDCEIRDECHAEIEEAHKNGNGRWNTRCLFERRIEDRMRELGIKVDR